MARRRTGKFSLVAVSVIGLVFIGAVPAMAASEALSASAVDFNTVVNRLTSLIVPIIISLAFLIFLVGAGRIVLGGHDPQHETYGKRMMIFSIVGVVLVLGAQIIFNTVKGLFS